MDSDRMHDRDVEDVELARRLEAYAQARLSPSRSATTRMRERVMAAANRQAAIARADESRVLASSGAAARPTLLHAPRWRRPLAALLAASLTLALAVGSVAAARPGGPLYEARVWAETLTLPSSAADRAAAEASRLDERLSEAADASAAGDTQAADAALAAYNAIVTEATAGTHGDPVANATLDTAVRRNIVVLTVLVGRVPDQAKDAIEHAIEESSSAVNGLHDQPGVGGPPANPGPNNAEDHSANPNKPAPTPERTPKPHPTPKPRPAPEHQPDPGS